MNNLTEQERKKIIILCNQTEYSQLPPSQIVQKLVDKGEYIASESSFYRILKKANQLNYRDRAKAKQKRA
ncbi:MAG: helix-turn-helix domain-containing protein [Endozoicomonadaceae bacterium]|nr:helix-turn-helix domain-containing protein [Endozoicomonadaceae bacterium]